MKRIRYNACMWSITVLTMLTIIGCDSNNDTGTHTSGATSEYKLGTDRMRRALLDLVARDFDHAGALTDDLLRLIGGKERTILRLKEEPPEQWNEDEIIIGGWYCNRKDMVFQRHGTGRDYAIRLEGKCEISKSGQIKALVTDLGCELRER